MYQKTIKIQKEDFCDVAVIGGGTSGIYAAICCAKNDAKTLLVEKSSVLGGTITNCKVDYPGLFHAWGKQIIGGPCWQAILETAKLGGAIIPQITYNPVNHWDQQIKLNTFIYATVVEKMCLSSGVDLRYHTMVAFCEKNGDLITLGVVGKEGMYIIHAKRIIDCTGDANIVQMLGFDVERSSELQPATLINRIDGYDFNKIDSDDVNQRFENAIIHSEISEADFQGYNPLASLRDHCVHMHIHCPDVSDSQSKTALEIQARNSLLRIVSFLRTIKGAENLYVSDFAPECGVRETARIIGETRMTVENYVSGYKYPDALAYCFYPVDRHISEGIKQIFLKESVIPTIPYGALIPKDSKNVIVAGRCASGDSDSNSAYRVQASCMAMGQIAGTAAALSCKYDCPIPNLDLSFIKKALTEIGAIVP